LITTSPGVPPSLMLPDIVWVVPIGVVKVGSPDTVMLLVM
jgi:hypothetical protein